MPVVGRLVCEGFIFFNLLTPEFVSVFYVRKFSFVPRFRNGPELALNFIKKLN